MEEPETKDGILIHGGDYFSVISPLKAPDGKLESSTLVPRQGWSSTHLFGGNGALPFWHSTKPVPPNVPVVFYTNGTRNRKPLVGNMDVVQQGSELKIKFEGEWHTIKLPFKK